jgi:hypothetical protein
MSSRLHTLLALRRRHEDQAAAEVVARARERFRAEDDQRRLDDMAEAARVRAVAARVAQSGSLSWSLAATAAQAQAAERLTLRLNDQAARAAQAATEHRNATLAAADAAVAAARLAHRERQQAREAVERVQARADAGRRRMADRRAEDAASDLRRQRP